MSWLRFITRFPKLQTELRSTPKPETSNTPKSKNFRRVILLCINMFKTVWTTTIKSSTILSSMLIILINSFMTHWKILSGLNKLATIMRQKACPVSLISMRFWTTLSHNFIQRLAQIQEKWHNSSTGTWISLITLVWNLTKKSTWFFTTLLKCNTNLQQGIMTFRAKKTTQLTSIRILFYIKIHCNKSPQTNFQRHSSHTIPW